MAKTRLIGAVQTAMNALATQMDVINNSFENFAGIDESDLTELVDKYNAAKTAMAALGTHLTNLQRREENPSVRDRIRNLKNVFKDQKELSSKRAAARNKFDQYQTELGLIKNDIEDTIGVVHYVRDHYT